jgi:hypothetical protein
MTTITLELPNEIAERARAEGLLDPERFQELLEKALPRAANEAGPGKCEWPARRHPCAQLADSARLHDDLIHSDDTRDWELA